MKLRNLIHERLIKEKKEALATSTNTNITIHCDTEYKAVGDDGTPHLSFTVSMSSTGGKELTRQIADKDEAEKFEQAVKLELRRALRKFDKRVEYIIQKYKLQAIN
jgi:hypothetical protein